MSSKQENDVELETILSKFSTFGPYYMKSLALVILIILANELLFMAYVFAAADVGYRCKYPDCEEDSNFVESLASANIIEDRCHRYAYTENKSALLVTCSLDNVLMSHKEQCDDWVYEEQDSFIEEFQLACQDWKRTLIGTGFGIGYMIGLTWIGGASDKIGRKKMMACSAVVGALIGYTKSFITWYWVYLVFEILGTALCNILSPVYIYTVEITSKENRIFLSVGSQMFCNIGVAIMGLVAYLVPYWRNYLRAIHTPALLSILVIMCLDESARWLLSKGRKKEAVEIIKRIAKSEKVIIDDDTLNRLKCEEKSSSADLLTLFKMTISSKKLLLRFLGCALCWIGCCFTSQTLTINSVSLQGNKYLNFSLSALVTVPACLMLFPVLKNFSRKGPLAVTLVLSGIFCTIQPFVPKDYRWASLVLYLCGKTMISMSFPTLYLYTSELFPTYTRNTMHALCSAMGRVGTMLAPQTPLLIRYWSGLPALLVGGLALTTGIITCFMPDTGEDELPDNVDEAEGIGSRQLAVDEKELSNGAHVFTIS